MTIEQKKPNKLLMNNIKSQECGGGERMKKVEGPLESRVAFL